MENKKDNLILDLTFNFSLEIVKYTEQLEGLKKYNLSNQLFRSGTSIGANVHEAQNAESKADFIHKLKIPAKEAEETRYWLLICQNSSNYPDCKYLLEQIESINKVLGKIISSSKNNSQTYAV
ncbi:MAG TPA: four helix bundle protein [Bacteroidia bacterium]|jgi:four helix bundle protein